VISPFIFVVRAGEATPIVVISVVKPEISKTGGKPREDTGSVHTEIAMRAASLGARKHHRIWLETQWTDTHLPGPDCSDRQMPATVQRAHQLRTSTPP